MYWVDLHMHSYWSFDGFSSPDSLVQRAQSLGLRLISVTEHDNTDSWGGLLKIWGVSNLCIVPGIEITAQWQDITLGILGIGFDPHVACLKKFLSSISEEDLAFQQRWLSAAKKKGLRMMSSALSNWFDEIFPDFPERRHRYVPEWVLVRLLQQSGLASSLGEAESINTQLVIDACHPELPGVREVLQLVKTAGGLAICEHPPANLAAHDILELMSTGFDGIELFHGGLELPFRHELMRIAELEDWLVTAGSDHHGTRKGWGRRGQLLEHSEAMFASVRSALSRTAYGAPGA